MLQPEPEGIREQTAQEAERKSRQAEMKQQSRSMLEDLVKDSSTLQLLRSMMQNKVNMQVKNVTQQAITGL